MSGTPVDTPASGAPNRPSVADNARHETLRALARLQPHEREALHATTGPADDALAERRPAVWLAARWLQRLRALGPPGEALPASAALSWHDRRHAQPMSHLDDRHFVMVAHEALLHRGCQRDELEHWTQELEEGRTSRSQLMTRLLLEQRQQQRWDAERSERGELAFHIMGTGERVTEAAWRQRCMARLAEPPPAEPSPAASPLPPLPSGLRISAVTSLYKGGRHIERYLSNMAAQTCFATHMELVIVDADSPDGEQALIEDWARRHGNIRYLRLPGRVGIYEAWNIAVRMSSGSLLTSANVDDLRRGDSVEQQARLLVDDEAVDVVYQDFFYTLDPDLPFDDIARVGFRSQLPDTVDAAQLMRGNPPHNAPMWRKRLHDELGLFDETLQSAGDYDFWMRCALAGKRFGKTADAHVAYFHNPEGLSTRPDTRGYAETREVHRRYARWIHGLQGLGQTACRIREVEK